MTILAAIFFTLAFGEAAILYAGYQVNVRQAQEHARLWQHIETLEADKRALTESLCRAEGKPFIRHNEPLKPSEGWWDGQPEVKAKIS